ncbi:GNAT family N-acetyltransferase [Streptomyces sp. NPDC046332]|uniref:GNAT family N-acetyltransferase n=1 Tax=Streptomyces sp. NPDC046332 TaxID=3155133 RepID=UPI0033CC1DE6
MPSRPTEAQVRTGTEGDLAPLTELYDPYVRETAITFDTEPSTPERRLPWLRSYPEDGPHRLLVAHDDRPDAAGRGIGTLLHERLFEALAAEDVHRACAGIALSNEPSIRLRARFGFRHVETYGEVGRT